MKDNSGVLLDLLCYAGPYPQSYSIIYWALYYDCVVTENTIFR